MPRHIHHWKCFAHEVFSLKCSIRLLNFPLTALQPALHPLVPGRAQAPNIPLQWPNPPPPESRECAPGNPERRYHDREKPVYFVSLSSFGAENSNLLQTGSPHFGGVFSHARREHQNIEPSQYGSHPTAAYQQRCRRYRTPASLFREPASLQRQCRACRSKIRIFPSSPDSWFSNVSSCSQSSLSLAHEENQDPRIHPARTCPHH